MPIRYPLMHYPIQTARLRLEPFQATDGDALYAMESDAEIKRYAGGALTRSQSDKALQKYMAAVRETGFGPVAIKLLATGQIIGLCGLYGTDNAGEAEIFYGLVRDAWGEGYAAEAGTAYLWAGIRQMGLSRILASVHPENVRSIRVLEKIGMTFSHVISDHQPYGTAHLYCLSVVQPNAPR